MMTYQVQAEDGALLDAHFDLDDNCIVFHSRGGTKGKGARNVDYSPALRLLLERLSAAGSPVQKAWVDSSMVQDIPLPERTILGEADVILPPAEQLSRMASRMQAIGRQPTSKSPHGNSTKRIRLQLTPGIPKGELLAILKATAAKKDFRSEERLPASELAKVTPEHLWNAVRLLLGGFKDHGFDESTDYDVLLGSGERLPPKAVFGVAASEALGFQVLPKHFAAGKGTPCFHSLAAAGYRIVHKGGPEVAEQEPERTDQEWAEGGPTVRRHLHRERSSGLREAKKAEFRRTHDGKLFCERCQEDPTDKYGVEDGDACIEVHHAKVQVADMEGGHKTKLEDLKCLCANCHRYEHRLLRKADQTSN